MIASNRSSTVLLSGTFIKIVHSLSEKDGELMDALWKEVANRLVGNHVMTTSIAIEHRKFLKSNLRSYTMTHKD